MKIQYSHVQLNASASYYNAASENILLLAIDGFRRCAGL